MKGYVVNIEEVTKENNNFREVLYTAKGSQLVVMSLAAGEDIGAEVHHDIDQFIRIEAGHAKAVLDGVEHDLPEDFAVVIPAGVEHNIINIGDEPVKLYSIYTPPEHKHGTIHPTKAEAVEEHFDGVTSE